LIEVLRATEEWQRAGAYSVRIQGMNKAHHISLREEFDEHDGDGTRYIVMLEDGYPVATCRFYPIDATAVMVGRVVVLPEYRGQKLGSRLLAEAEQWIQDLQYREIYIESRIEAVGFYEKNGYRKISEEMIKSWKFDCVRMGKKINGSSGKPNEVIL